MRKFKSDQTRKEKVYPNFLAEFGDLSLKYKVIREISRGAYGVVYLAKFKHDQKDKKDNSLAIKVIWGTVSPKVILNELRFLKILNKRKRFC